MIMNKTQNYLKKFGRDVKDLYIDLYIGIMTNYMKAYNWFRAGYAYMFYHFGR